MPPPPVRRPVRSRGLYVYAHTCPCPQVNTVSRPFFREGGRRPHSSILSLRIYNTPPVSTISRPPLLVAHSAYRPYVYAYTRVYVQTCGSPDHIQCTWRREPGDWDAGPTAPGGRPHGPLCPPPPPGPCLRTPNSTPATLPPTEGSGTAPPPTRVPHPHPHPHPPLLCVGAFLAPPPPLPPTTPTPNAPAHHRRHPRSPPPSSPTPRTRTVRNVGTTSRGAQKWDGIPNFPSFPGDGGPLCKTQVTARTDRKLGIFAAHRRSPPRRMVAIGRGGGG